MPQTTDLQKNYQYKALFGGRLSKIGGDNIDKYLSLASLEPLKSLLPNNIDLSSNKDLIACVLNCAVAGRVNKNGDCITVDTGVKIAKNFIWKYVDISHKTDRIVGVICNAGFSELGSNAILTEEQALASENPVNISLAILIYKMAVTDSFVELLEESSDEASPNFNLVSSSWELLFNDFDIAVGGKDLKDAKIITDPDEKAKYVALTKDGLFKDSAGNYVYRVIKGDFLIPAGIGLTENPAADVKGLLIVENEEQDNENSDNSEDPSEDSSEASSNTSASTIENNISQTTAEDVNNSKDNINNIENPHTDMSKITKFTKLEDINDENLKLATASTVIDFINDEMKKASDKWEQENKSKETALAEAKANHESILAEATKTKETLELVQKELQELKNKAIAQENETKFNTRMAYFDSEYELDADDRKVIVAEINGLNDESFDKYSAKLSTLLRGKNKKVIAENKQKQEAELSALKEKLSKASTSTTEPENKDKTITDALKNGQKDVPVPNASFTEGSLKDRFAKHFEAKDIIETHRNRK